MSCNNGLCYVYHPSTVLTSLGPSLVPLYRVWSFKNIYRRQAKCIIFPVLWTSRWWAARSRLRGNFDRPLLWSGSSRYRWNRLGETRRVFGQHLHRRAPARGDSIYRPGSSPGHAISSASLANVTPLDAPRWDQTCDLEVKVDQNIRYMKNKVLFRDPVFLLLSRLHSELCLNR